MPITDRVVRNVDVVYDGVFDMRDFLDFLKKWFKSKGYDVAEKLYDTKGKEHIKSIKIKWDAEKKPTDYDKYIIKLAVECSDMKEAKLEGTKVTEGKIKVTFDADHEKDYEEKWRKKPTFNFIRAVYDKFIAEEKEGRLAKKLKEEDYDLVEEVKKYFNIK